MTEDSGARVSSQESTVANDASQTRQRRKRKWDQPAESLVSAGVAIPGVLSLGNMGPLGGIPLPGVAPVSGVHLINPLAASGTTIAPLFQVPSIHQLAATSVPKVIQPKIQDELIIAREIVINDAESSVRYKLTKRQTQEEIQRCTGAVVITRGKYRPPNALPDGEKPLYLHISAGAHLKETAERILAVDRAAALVEEMLKQGPNSLAGSSTLQTVIGNGVKGTQPLTTSVYLGFDADQSLNVAARIRGPNDQYINHIMNETGATVILRGRGSGNFENPTGEEMQQPLHLFLSSSNPKSLEDAKRLAENLLDTISVEFGASRVSSSKVYGAVPPPQQLLTGVQSSDNEQNTSAVSASAMASSVVCVTPARSVSSVPLPGPATVFLQGPELQPGGVAHYGQSQPNMVSYPLPALTRGTSYSGYGGIYPQATPLQQVALALRQSTSPATSTVAPASVASTTSKSSDSSPLDKEKQHPQKRKFQELSIASKGSAKPDQGLKVSKPCEPSIDLGLRNVSNMPAPKQLVQPSSNGMPPLPPRSMPPPPSRGMPPPPPKFVSSKSAVRLHDNNLVVKPDTVPDTLVKLMEYGEEDDDLDETTQESFSSNSSTVTARKPFWAV